MIWGLSYILQMLGLDYTLYSNFLVDSDTLLSQKVTLLVAHEKMTWEEFDEDYKSSN